MNTINLHPVTVVVVYGFVAWVVSCVQWTLANPDPVSPNPRKSEVQAPSSRITFGMILGLKVTLCACALNNYL